MFPAVIAYVGAEGVDVYYPGGEDFKVEIHDGFYGYDFSGVV